MAGGPGKTSVTVTVGNRSSKTISGTLRLRLPASWKAITREIPIAGLEPGQTRPVVCEFEWTTDWRPGESATVELDCGAGGQFSRPLIPRQYGIHRARDITLDGRLDDWGPETRWPAWMLGSTAGDSNASAHLAWAPEGVYGAVEVHDFEGPGQRPEELLGHGRAGVVPRHRATTSTPEGPARATTSSGWCRCPKRNASTWAGGR